MIRRDARFERRERARLADLVHAENRPAAVADINIAFVIKRQSRGDPQIGSHGLYFLERRYSVKRAVVTAGHIQDAFAAERHAGRIDYVGDEGRDRIVGRDFIDRNWDLLTALPGQRHINATVITIDRRVGYRMQILRDLSAEF